MKSTVKQVKKIASKGDRLNWAPLKDAVAIKLTPELIKGKALNAIDLNNNRNANTCVINPVMP